MAFRVDYRLTPFCIFLSAWFSSAAFGQAACKPLTAYAKPKAPKNTGRMWLRFGLPCLLLKNIAWTRNPIDRFILARLEKAKLAPSPPADKITLLRRVTST